MLCCNPALARGLGTLGGCRSRAVALRGMARSALRASRDALAAGEAALAPHGSRYPRRAHTRPQLFAP